MRDHDVYEKEVPTLRTLFHFWGLRINKMSWLTAALLPPVFKLPLSARAKCYWPLMVKGAKFAEKGIIEYGKQLLLQKRKSAERLAKELNLKILEYQPVA